MQNHSIYVPLEGRVNVTAWGEKKEWSASPGSAHPEVAFQPLQQGSRAASAGSGTWRQTLFSLNSHPAPPSER